MQVLDLGFYRMCIRFEEGKWRATPVPSHIRRAHAEAIRWQYIMAHQAPSLNALDNSKIRMLEILEQPFTGIDGMVATVEELEQARNDPSGPNGPNGPEIVLMQISAPWCERCPAFTACVSELMESHRFRWVQAELPEAAELQEHYEIHQLPAFVLGTAEDEIVEQGASLETLRQAVRSRCPPKLVLDDEF